MNQLLNREEARVQLIRELNQIVTNQEHIEYALREFDRSILQGCSLSDSYEYSIYIITMLSIPGEPNDDRRRNRIC